MTSSGRSPRLPFTRRVPIGAEVVPARGVHFRTWAPASTSVRVIIEEPGPTMDAVLESEGDGYFSGLVESIGPGACYWLELDNGQRHADPASRFQPNGPHGASAVIDASTYRWNDRSWRGPRERTPIVYELHAGTFTPEGTWAAAAAHLPWLKDLGISMIEVMPVAEFPGQFGWGYDGVLLFAPTRLYGTPDDLRAFVDAAHTAGLSVILDVVYNHFGPDGCPLAAFSPDYFSRDTNEWGQGINFDGDHSGPVREFIVSNAGYWIEEFHFDGLRLDATQSIHDRSERHVLTDITRAVREKGGERRTWIVAENEPQDSRLLRPEDEGGSAMDALWNDDFHHSAMVAATGRREAYYSDYLGRPQEFISAVKRGFLYQGQWYAWQAQPRGTSTRRLPAASFVAFLQNHDQVANSKEGRRLHAITSAGTYRALTALLLLGPWTPMLFQGQEFASSSPFLFFADHKGDLASAVRRGRREFLRQFPSLADDAVGRMLADPSAADTFARSTLDHGERISHAADVALHRSLIALRLSDAAFQGEHFDIDGAVVGERAFVLRWTDRRAEGDTAKQDRLLLVNLGGDELLPTVAEPLLSPFPATRWRTIWSSDDPAFGGPGRREIDQTWRLPAQCALVLETHS